jgi:hypothetical protein
MRRRTGAEAPRITSRLRPPSGVVAAFSLRCFASLVAFRNQRRNRNYWCHSATFRKGAAKSSLSKIRTAGSVWIAVGRRSASNLAGVTDPRFLADIQRTFRRARKETRSLPPRRCPRRRLDASNSPYSRTPEVSRKFENTEVVRARAPLPGVPALSLLDVHALDEAVAQCVDVDHTRVGDRAAVDRVENRPRFHPGSAAVCFPRASENSAIDRGVDRFLRRPCVCFDAGVWRRSADGLPGDEPGRHRFRGDHRGPRARSISRL